MNKIIVFANQKGGVGKSTICTLFANYLCWKKENVCIIDTDLQQTVAQMRKSDLDFYGSEAPYSIQAFPVADIETMGKLMENAKKFDGVVLIDAPGNLNQDGLIPLLSKADFVVCPFRYDKATTSSTITFVKAFRRIEKDVPGTKTQLLFLPNNISRKGNLEEKKVWKQNVDTFDMVGTVLPMIPSRASLERFDTMDITASQRDVVKNTFEEITKLLKA
jgi:chromosome partitioning protein